MGTVSNWDLEGQSTGRTLLMTLKGKCLISFWTSFSLNLRPIRRFCHWSASGSIWGHTPYTHNVEDGSVGVARVLVLGGVTNEAFLVGESDPRRSDTVTCGVMISSVA